MFCETTCTMRGNLNTTCLTNVDILNFFYNCAPPKFVVEFSIDHIPLLFFWGVKFFYPLELIQATIRPGFFFSTL